MSRFRHIVLPVLLLAAAGGATAWLLHSQPEPKKQTDAARPFSVKAAKLQPSDYTVMLDSRGTVAARTMSTLIPEVPGRIVEISPNLREGGFFEKDEPLMRLDPRDYEAAVTIAGGAVATAKTVLEEEKARAAQALDDWKRLGRTGTPPPLLSRTPQLAEAQAKYDSALAQQEKAARDLERTLLRAPYPGCVMKKMADVGQVVTAGTKLAEIYAIDFAEVALPLNDRDLAFVDLPESFRGEKDNPATLDTPVKLKATYGGREYSWDAVITRTAGSIDEKSRNLTVIAQVADPCGRKAPDLPPLKVGLFVRAEITGHTLPGVYVLPASSVREGSQVVIIDAENKIHRRSLTVLWRTRDSVIASRESLKPGETLCLTNLPFAIDGASVKPTLTELPRPAKSGPQPLTTTPAAPPPPAGGKSA